MFPTDAEIEGREVALPLDLDVMTTRLVVQFHERSRKADGTPLFRRLGPDAVILRALVREALEKVRNESR
jgi:hypothetical protein